MGIMNVLWLELEIKLFELLTQLSPWGRFLACSLERTWYGVRKILLYTLRQCKHTFVLKYKKIKVNSALDRVLLR